MTSILAAPIVFFQMYRWKINMKTFFLCSRSSNESHWMQDHLQTNSKWPTSQDKIWVRARKWHIDTYIFKFKLVKSERIGTIDWAVQTSHWEKPMKRWIYNWIWGSWDTQAAYFPDSLSQRRRYMVGSSWKRVQVSPDITCDRIWLLT
jgi:hypothetical protein